MNRKRALEVMEITRETYELIGEEFSNTRESVWVEMEGLAKKYIRSGMKVLDVGCGNGRLVDILKGVDYLGVDGSEALIKEAKKRGSNFKLLDILELNKLDGKFDGVFMFASFNHVMSKKFRLKVLRDIKSLLKSGGWLIMTNWNMWQVGVKKSVWRYNLKRPGMYFEDVMTEWQSRDGQKKGKLYYRAFGLGELKRLLRKAGFEVVENYYSLNGEKSNWRKGRNIVSVARC